MEADGARTDVPSLSERSLASFSVVLLALFTITSFSANIFLVATILSSSRLRRTVINFFLVHIAAINLLETAIDMVTTLVYISMRQLESRPLCVLNSATGQLVIIMTIAGLTLLSVDRCIALTHTSQYRETFTALRAGISLFTSWLIGLCFTLPILAESVKSRIYPYRYFCSISSGNDLAYIVALVVICYVLPLGVVLCTSGLIFLKARVDRLNRRSNSDLRFSHSSYIVEARRFQDHLALSKFTIALIILFILLEGPYIILNAVVLIRNSKEIKQSYMSRELKIDGESETAVTWLKFVFPVVYPFLVFGFCKDIWKKFQDLICCKKTNMIRSAMTSSPDSPNPDRSNTEYPPALTIVATDNGLAYTDGQAPDAYVYADLRSHQQPQSNFDEIEQAAATSDYGSEDGNTGGNEVNSGNNAQIPSTSGTGQLSQDITGGGEVIEGDIRKTTIQVIEGASVDDDQDDEEPEQQAALSSSQLIFQPPAHKGHGRASSDSVVSFGGLRSILKRPTSVLPSRIATLPGNISLGTTAEYTMDDQYQAKKERKEVLLAPENLLAAQSDFSEVEDTKDSPAKKKPGLKLPPLPTGTAFSGVPDVNTLDLTTPPPDTALSSSRGAILNPHIEMPVARYSIRFRNTMGIFANHKRSGPRKTRSSGDVTTTGYEAASQDRQVVSAETVKESNRPQLPNFPQKKFRPQHLGDAPAPAWNP